MTGSHLQHTSNLGQKKFSRRASALQKGTAVILTIFWLSLSACTTNLQTRVSGNLDQLSPKQSIAILPVGFEEKSHRKAANMFRQSLFANLKKLEFNLLEPYMVDGLLKKNGLTEPEKYTRMNPMHLGEILGVDAVLISRVNKVQRAYLILHSSIELSVSLQMVDTRTGEILWQAEQTESDFQGLGKIPTGITAAILAPIYFVTNQLNLNRLTSKMVDKLTTVLKNPDEDETFKEPVITAAASRDIDRLKKVEQVKSKWAEKKQAQPGNAKAHLAAINLFPIPPVTISAGYRSANKKPVETAQTENVETAKTRVRVSKPLQLVSKPPIFYTIQVGAYKTKIFAEKMIHSLANKGYNAFLALMPSKDKTPLYRVRVDQFEDKSEARSLARKLKTAEHLENFIIAQHPG
ncbi:Beta-hexosaminidase [hydrothermal vent metagenome]|uniref:Beta-hexosaminidase n=1 Tax=hydrothermal vent metagenome TaxID=652676 RepID=A0A3B1DI69_9ZZZZ